MSDVASYMLHFYVPHSYLEACKTALFVAGAGTYPGGKYSNACFEIAGTGQFRPNEGAVPNVGAVGQIEKIEEVKVEIICVGKDVMEKSVRALKKAHPYDVIAYYVMKMEDI